MRQTLLVELVETFTQKEQSSCKKWLASPIANNRKDVLQLFDVLCTYLKKKESIEKGIVFKKLFPEEVFNETKLRLLGSYLYKLLEEFLIYNSFNKHAIAHHALLLEIYRKRNLLRHFDITYKRSQKQLEKQSLKNTDYLIAKHRVEQASYQRNIIVDRSNSLNLQKANQQFNVNIVNQVLRQAWILTTHQLVYKHTYEVPFLENCLVLVENNPNYLSYLSIKIYYLSFKVIKEPENETNFNLFKNTLFQITDEFNFEELQALYRAAINFCIRKINENNTPYFNEAFELYEKGLKNEVLLENNRLSRFTFNNIIKLGLKLGQLDRTKNFIDNYYKLLEKSEQEIAFCLSSAQLAYHRKQYKTALLYMQRVGFKDMHHNIKAKVLQLKIYYEEGELDLLDAHIQSLQMYVRRKIKMSYHKQNYQNIIKITKKMLSLNPMDKTAIKVLKNEINTTNPLTEKEWFLQQIEVK